MAIVLRQRHRIWVFCLLGLGIWLHAPQCGFARTTQQPLSELRERTGLAIRKSAGHLDDIVLSREEKNLVRKIKIASEKRDWRAARALFAQYTGGSIQIYTAAMHAAFRCRKYKEGSDIYAQCLDHCGDFASQPFFSVALRIFAKLGETSRVEQIWNEALNKLNRWYAILGSARIAAAADLGDVEAAADTLDKMESSNVSIDVYHINSAMRACWGWGKKQHKAAKYFFDLLPRFQLSPTVVSFTSLIGACNTASLQHVVTAYKDMKSYEIEPDAVFAETYIFSVLKADHVDRQRFSAHLRELPSERLQAARKALNDFEKAGLSLHKVCIAVDQELTRMGF